MLFFSCTGNLAVYIGAFNNSLSCDLPTKRNLECLPSFFDLDLFGMNSTLDNNLSPENNLSIPRIQSHYFSPHNFNQYSLCLNKDRLENSPLAIVHNNTTSLNRNLEKLTSHYLNERDFPFNIIGVTETKITKSNEILCTTKIPGYYM